MSLAKRSRSGLRLRVMMRQISQSRGTKAFARYLSNTYRVLLLLSAAVLIELGFPAGSAPDLPLFREGVIADEDVIAPVTFPVNKSDEDLTRERVAAAASVSPVFDLRPQIADSALAAASEFFDNLDSAVTRASSAPDRRIAVELVANEFRVTLASANHVALLASRDTRLQLRAAIARAFDGRLREGVLRADIGAVGASGVWLRAGENDQLVLRDSLRTMQQFYEQSQSHLPRDAGGDLRRLYHSLLVRFSRATIEPNEQATQVLRDQAQQAVDAVEYEVLEGERIVAAHERVNPEELRKLTALQKALGQSDGVWPWRAHLGGMIFSLVLLVVFGTVLKYYRAEVYGSARSITLVWFVLVVVAAATALISQSTTPWQLIPIAFAALLLATLYDGLLALVTVFVLVGLVTIRQFPGVAVPFFTFAGGAAAALSGRVVRRRAQAWAFAAVIAGSYLLAAVSLGLLGLESLNGIVQSVLWGTVNGVGCTLVATGILPLAEAFTRITTDQSLLELADLNRPLLRRLSLEAPGTYAHSINVANLAEAAARGIGANSLLARVGVYYHDIGKVKKPQYFVENQPPGRNPHDKLKPSTSASIVREHVRDGLDLATEARLPDDVKAFISEHHGTQRIGFFWEKAQELEPDVEHNPSEFRYPGPKASSKETAIVLMADSVESAARVLQDPTPETITALVDRIVGAKLADGQLDEAPLTLNEVSTIKQQFVTVLTGMYHHRLDYPIQNQKPQQAEEPLVRGTS